MNIAITGGAGFVGSKLSESLARDGHAVLILDLHPPKQSVQGASFVKVDLMKEEVPERVLECDAIVHLAGVNIFGRWTKDYKELIVESRVKTAEALYEKCKEGDTRPSIFISASAIGYYGAQGETELTESLPPGGDFLATVCIAWERAREQFNDLGMRTVSVRTGIVLGPGGGMLKKLVPVFKWFLGGKLGNGEQWFSWIHIDDLIEVYKKALIDDSLEGPINAVSPEPVRNKVFTKALGKALKRPTLFFVPGFALKLVMGELGSVILGSQKVTPKKLKEAQFAYKYPSIDKALSTL
ncbi:TIGR01777 family protein [bacterium]|nr:TIGR01777 family protein [bacterium]|tara:strand:+ start:1165 stop:2055 length:891 start_codon:yes stop_codon:yes gene_type:complete